MPAPAPSLYSQKDWKLDPVAVRRRAKDIPGVELLPSHTEHVVSFLAGLDEHLPPPPPPPHNSNNNSSSSSSSNNKHQNNYHSSETAANNLARINVFVDTGTVSTCRVLQGIPRESFRRNVSSLDVVERLLRHPPNLIQINDSLVGTTDSSTTILAASKPQRKQQQQQSSTSTTDYAPVPTKSLQEYIELAEVGLCILNGEKEKLEHHLLFLEDEAQQQQRASDYPLAKNDYDHDENNNNSSSGGDEGMEFQFSLPASAMKHVEQCLQDISRMDKLVRGVATNGRGTIFLYGNGGVAYTPNIPKHLYQKLKVMRNSPISSRPSYVSLGTRDRYFVAFNDQTIDWKGPKALDKILKSLPTRQQQNQVVAPRSVAFGATYDTFFVVFGDGSWKAHGKSVPRALLDKLEERRLKASTSISGHKIARGGNDLVCVNLGPSGEWFLRVENGRMWFGGISEDLDVVTHDILQAGSFLHFIDFGGMRLICVCVCNCNCNFLKEDDCQA